MTKSGNKGEVVRQPLRFKKKVNVILQPDAKMYTEDCPVFTCRISSFIVTRNRYLVHWSEEGANSLQSPPVFSPSNKTTFVLSQDLVTRNPISSVYLTTEISRPQTNMVKKYDTNLDDH